MTATTVSVSPTPTEERERLPLLDILRGFALFGILLVNMEDFSAPNVPGLATIWPDRSDHIVSWLLRFAAETKFRALFAFLFGLGFALQIQRAESQGDPFLMRYLRRVGALLLVGVAHYLLLWEADILMTYALVGLLLLLFAHRPPGTALRTAAMMAGIAVTLLSVIVLFAHPRAENPSSAAPSIPAAKVQMVAIYSRGSYRDVVTYRARQMGMQLARIIPAAPLALMLFLVGLAAGKAGIAHAPANHRVLLRRVFVWCLVFGLISNYMVTVYASSLLTAPKMTRALIVASYVLGGPTLALAYLSGLTLLLLNRTWQVRLRLLAAPGRLALTNYLMQSVVCTTLFYGYGFGWYNHLRPLAGVGLCVAIFLAQMGASSLWLHRFRYGPAEWLWRSLTYQRRLPMRAPTQNTPLRR